MSEWTFDSAADCWRCAHCGCKEASGYHEAGCPKRAQVDATTKLHHEFRRLTHELTTQDNAFTSDPIFVVQQKRVRFGMDMDYCEHFAWVDSEGEREIRDDTTDAEDQATLALLEKAYNAEIDWPDELGDEELWTRTGYDVQWEFVQPFLTRAAAEQFRADQAHNLGESRVYVESGYNNPEWKLLRQLVAYFATSKEYA